MEDDSKINGDAPKIALTINNKMLDFFPQSTRKFIEVSTGEILFIKESGEAYYQRDSNNNNLI